MRQATRKSLITVAAASGVLAITGGGTAYADSGAQGAAKGSPGIASGNNVQAPVHVPVNVCGNTVNVVGALNPASGNSCANGGGHHRGGHGGGGHHGGGHSGSHRGGHTGNHGGGAGAQGVAKGSPGVVSGNNVQAPVHVPVNVCGNTVTGVGGLNPATGNRCGNNTLPEGPGDHTPPPNPPGVERPNPPGDNKPEPPDEGKPPAPEQPDTPDEEKPKGPGDKGPKQPGTPERPAEAREGSVPVKAEPAPEAELASTGTAGLAAAVPTGAALLLGGYVLYRRGRARAGVR